MHYFQRPDADPSELRPRGHVALRLGRRGSTSPSRAAISSSCSRRAPSRPDSIPTTSASSTRSSDVINISILPAYQWTQAGQGLPAGPGRAWAASQLRLRRQQDLRRLRLGLLQGSSAISGTSTSTLVYNPGLSSNRLTRGGPLALSPWGLGRSSSKLSTDSRQPIVLESARRSVPQHAAVTMPAGAPRSPCAGSRVGNVSLSVGPQYMSEANQTQWVAASTIPLMTATYGARYVFGRIDQKIVSAEIRLNWTFTPGADAPGLSPAVHRASATTTGSRSWPGPETYDLQRLRPGRLDDRLRRRRLHGRSGRRGPGRGRSPSAIPTST